LRAIWVAGIGGLVVGHILWLAGISAAIASANVPAWVLVVAGVSLILGLASALLGRRKLQRKDRKSEIWAAFLFGLSISPVLFSLAVLGVTYL
jgi:predicted phage tail protein